jgi:hypothetical protein
LRFGDVPIAHNGERCSGNMQALYLSSNVIVDFVGLAWNRRAECH